MSKNGKLIDIYYDLYVFLDDDNLFVDAMKHFTKTDKFKSAIAVQLENLRLTKLEKELNILYDTPIKELKRFAKLWRLEKRSLFDFEKEQDW